MKFIPAQYLRRVIPKGVRRHGLLNEKLDVKKSYLKAIVLATAVSQATLTAQVYNVVEAYRLREKQLQADGIRAFKREAVNGQKLLSRRIEHFLTYAKVQEIKQKYKGRHYRWLPSTAKEPDPEHQLLYGKVFLVGEGDKDGYMPGERWGCQCGIEILDY